MFDQASVLRNMARQAPRRAAPGRLPPPRMWAITGPAGAGVTHVAARLAVGLAEQGARVVLIDGDLADWRTRPRTQPSAIDNLCAAPCRYGVHDVLLARASLHEIFCPGPAGVLIAAQTPQGIVAGDAASSHAAQARVIREIKALGEFAEVVLVDCGRFADAARGWLEAADETAYVGTPQPSHITEIYAGLKELAACQLPVHRHMVVNRAASLEEGLDVWRRVRATCERFLAIDLAWLGALPDDESPPCDDLEMASAIEAMSLRTLGRVGRNHK